MKSDGDNGFDALFDVDFPKDQSAFNDLTIGEAANEASLSGTMIKY